MSHYVRAGTAKKFSKKHMLRAKLLSFVPKSVTHFCFLDVVVAAKAFYWQGEVGYALKSSCYIRLVLFLPKIQSEAGKEGYPEKEKK